MGAYFHPGNAGFQEILQSEYVDKTGLIALINETIGTTGKLSCVSRPRRFGKTYAAKMLSAYYDCSCDSRRLFDDRAIAGTEGYLTHLNQYHVVSIDVAGFVSGVRKRHGAMGDMPERMEEKLYQELVSFDSELGEEKSLADCLIRCVEKTGRQFIFILDEWDAPIREAREDPAAQTAYLNLLREWFKNNNFTPRVVAAAYMTGILPIKKDGSQSAISDFMEYSIVNPGRFARFTGFLEEEVEGLCADHGMRFEEARQWYDGYDFPGVGAIYNPYSVMCAIHFQEFQSYWRKTSAAESLFTYINMDFEGMQEMVSRLISGEEIEVDIDGFENDFETFRSRDDVLTLLIHLGYLTWNRRENTARIPNEEVRAEFRKILKGGNVNRKWIDLIRRSQRLLEDTLAGKEDAVIDAIQAIRDTQYAPTFYNDEQALRYVIKFAYIAAADQYLKIEELPSGKGIADVVYLPKPRTVCPALVVELKWNKSAEGAIRQIKERNYPAVMRDYGGEIVLVGINYDEKSKKHSCVIERV
ncbi:MAG: ATP-binding protein [Roseburia sp.]|nr:ATP-binding protein [Roseburia sp.]MCM1097397.1 ATP-binding protein [Ruminococcus flavefaciens]